MTLTGPLGPQRLGRYVLLERIGSGGMADVFRAVAQGAKGFQRASVVKRIRPELSSSSAFVNMFVTEARVSALLNHSNIVQIYDFGHADGCYYLAMEYLDGKDLWSVLMKSQVAGKRLEPGIAAFVAAQVARGLAYAHTRTLPGGEPLKLVHRDVSPSNIMLLRSGGVKLLDFGIAKVQAPLLAAENTQGGACKGKFSYLAPEQARGGRVDNRSDIFSLGVVLWESLVGRSLFRGIDDVETLRNVFERPIPSPMSLRPEVPSALDQIVLRALERDPDRRYPTAAAMADDLESVLQDLRFQSRSVASLLEDLFGEDSQEVLVNPPVSHPTVEHPTVPLPTVQVLPPEEQSPAGVSVQVGPEESPSLPPLLVPIHQHRGARGSGRTAWFGLAIPAGLLLGWVLWTPTMGTDVSRTTPGDVVASMRSDASQRPAYVPLPPPPVAPTDSGRMGTPAADFVSVAGGVERRDTQPPSAPRALRRRGGKAVTQGGARAVPAQPLGEEETAETSARARRALTMDPFHGPPARSRARR